MENMGISLMPHTKLSCSSRSIADRKESFPTADYLETIPADIG